MPKSSHKLGVWHSSFYRRFSRKITDIYYEKYQKKGFPFEELPKDLYADFWGWEAVQYFTNGDIPILWTCIALCQEHDIKYKLARYQVWALAQKLGIELDH